jgi:hypothetical protein
MTSKLPFPVRDSDNQQTIDLNTLISSKFSSPTTLHYATVVASDIISSCSGVNSKIPYKGNLQSTNNNTAQNIISTTKMKMKIETETWK